jgi:hypothetical protein
VPTVLRRGALRFFFYSNEGDEEPHVHVQREAMVAKVWLRRVSTPSSGGFSDVEVRRIERIVVEQREMLMRAWHDFFRR